MPYEPFRGRAPLATLATVATVHAPDPQSVANVASVAEPLSNTEALEAFEERAAIVEFDGGLPRAHAEVLAALHTAPKPPRRLPASSPKLNRRTRRTRTSTRRTSSPTAYGKLTGASSSQSASTARSRPSSSSTPRAASGFCRVVRWPADATRSESRTGLWSLQRATPPGPASTLPPGTPWPSPSTPGT